MATRKRTQPARPARQPAKLEDFIGRMSAGFLDCRDMGHTWRPWGARWHGDAAGFERVLRCGRCKTERVQIVTRFGSVISNRYRYPEGYVTPKLDEEHPRITRDQFRLESIARFVRESEKEG